jgi:hypothetical protein
MAVVSLFVSWSLPSDGSICYNSNCVKEQSKITNSCLNWLISQNSKKKSFLRTKVKCITLEKPLLGAPMLVWTSQTSRHSYIPITHREDRVFISLSNYFMGWTGRHESHSWDIQLKCLKIIGYNKGFHGFSQTLHVSTSTIPLNMLWLYSYTTSHHNHIAYTSGSQTVRRGALGGREIFLGRREIFKYFHWNDT